MTVQELRQIFPELSRKVYGKDLVYLDNAATSQRPQTVIDEWTRLSAVSNANIHRAVHLLSSEATEAYELSRDAVREYIGAESRQEVIFTSGTTMSINLVASSFSDAFISQGDEVIVSEAEHHSNLVSWQLACQRRGASIRAVPVDECGYLDLNALESLISPRTRIVALTHISNVLGLVNPVKAAIELCHKHGVPVLIDGAQGIVHEKVDVQDLDCDFYVFSGHKMYAATGTGVLYGKKKWLDAMPPYMGGGEMVGTVRLDGTTYAPLPAKFEAGTQNIAGAATLKPALELLKSLNDKELISSYEAVKEYMLNALQNFPGLRLFGVPRRTEDKIGLFSFTIEGVHHEDLALILDKMGVAVRSGQMCAEPLMDRYGVSGMLRASFAPYNSMQEAEYFVKSLKKAVNMLK